MGYWHSTARAIFVIFAVAIPLSPRVGTTGPLRVMPSVTLGVGVEGPYTDDASAFFHSWLGIALIPGAKVHTALFTSIGAEFDLRHVVEPERDEWVLELRPTIRAGISFYGERPRVVPRFSAYALAGWYPTARTGNPQTRLGVGLSLPQYGFFLAKVRFPNVLEGTVDIGSRELRWFARLGWGF